MKKILGLTVLILSTLAPVASAVKISETKMVVGREVIVSFPNGARVEYLELFDKDNLVLGDLVYIKDGQKTSLSQEAFSFDLGYKLAEKDGACIVKGQDGAYVLTEQGTLTKVFLDPAVIDPSSVAVKTVQYNKTSYVVVGAKARGGRKQYGEMFIVRLSDGAIGTVNERMAEAFAPKGEHELAITESSETFDLDGRFEAAMAKRSILEDLHASRANAARRAAGVTDPDAVVTVYLEREHIFENGNKLSIALKEGSQNVGMVNFIGADGKPVRVAKGKFTELPNNQNTRRDQKLALVGTESEMFVVSNSGNIVKLEANYKQIDHRNGAFANSSKAFEAEGRQYMLVSFSYGSGSDKSHPGETLLVRDDGEWLRVDYLSHKYGADFLDHDIRDGILHMRGTPRLIDLRAFEAEAQFKPTFTEGAEKALEEVEKSYRDLTHELSSGGQTAFKAMDQEALSAMREGFQMQEAKSVVVLGESGTGKTELVRSFIRGMANGDFPELPRTWRVFQLDPVSLNSGAQFVGMIEERLKNVTDAGRAVPIFLFIDEIHSMRGIGTHSGNQNDVFQYLKTGLANGDIRIIGTSTLDEYNDGFKGDSALDRRINKVIKREPKGSEIHTAVSAWTAKYKKTAPSEDVLEYAIRVAGEFNAEGAQPSKTLQLLEKVYASLAMSGKLKAAPTRADIDVAAQKLYQADPAQFDVLAMGKKLATLETQVNQKVAGHDSVKRTLFDLVRQAYAGTHDPTKPRVRYILAGPRGSGKTSLAFAIGEALNLPVRRFEMNTYREGDAPKLKGEIIEALRKNAFTILLFDEIEKAPTDVQQTLLGLLDSGIVSGADKMNTAASGGTRSTKISALNAMILATTNAGSAQVAAMTAAPTKPQIGFGEKTGKGASEAQVVLGSDAVKELLIRDGMAAPLVDRFQGAGWADAANADQFREVIRMHLRIALEDASKRLDIRLTLANEKAFVEALMSHYRPGTSNRKALELIQNSIRSVLAQARLSGAVTSESDVVLAYENGELRVASCEQILTTN